MYKSETVGLSGITSGTSRVVDLSLIYELMNIVVDNNIPVRFSVGNVGGLQSVSTRLCSVERGRGRTIHLRDPDVHLRIHLDQCETAWIDLRRSNASEGAFRLQGRQGESLLSLQGDGHDSRWARLLAEMIQAEPSVSSGCRDCKNPCSKGRAQEFANISILQGV